MTAPAYLVKGKDPMLRARVLDALIDEVLSPEERAFGLDDLTAPGRAGGAAAAGSASDDDEGTATASEDRESTIAAIVSAANSPPFMTERRLVLVRDAGAFTAADVGPLVAYLDDPLPSTVLVLVAGGGALAPALAKALKAIGAEERAPDTEKTADVLTEVAHDAGLQLASGAKAAISTHLGEDAGRVHALVETLMVAGGADHALTADEVRPYLNDEGAVPAYQLSGKIEDGDAAGALEILHRLLTVTSPQAPKPMHPLQILAMITNRYRRVMRLDDPSIRSEADAHTALGGKGSTYPSKLAWQASRAIGTDGIRQAFDAIAQADLDLKGASGLSSDVVIEVLVVRLARLHARRSSGGSGSRSARPPARSGRR